MEEKPPSFEQCLVQYRDQHLAARNFAPKTRSEYLADLAQLLTFLTNVCALTSPTRVQKRRLEGFLAELDRRGLRGSSRPPQGGLHQVLLPLHQRHRRPALRPCLEADPTGRERLQPRVLSEGEYKRLQLSCAHDIRDAAVIELILQTGIGLSEAAALTTAAIELPARVSRDGPPGSVQVHGKGRKERTVTVNWRPARR